MPKLSKKLPSYRHHKRSGQAVVNLSGKDIYLGPHGTKTSKDEYDRVIGEWLANGRILPESKSSKPTKISDLMAAYLKFANGFYVKRGKPTGEMPPLKSAIRTFRKIYGRTNVNEFGPLMLIAYQNSLIESGICRKYLNQQTGRIKRIFKWGVSRELVPVEVFQAISTMKSYLDPRFQADSAYEFLPELGESNGGP